MKATTSATLANFSASESRISITEFGFRLHIFSLNAELVNDNSGDLLENFFVHCNLHLDLIV